jgi:hypothetical protein
MTKNITNNGVPYNDGDGALHFAELMDIALNNPDLFDTIEKMIMGDVKVERILKIIKKVVK